MIFSSISYSLIRFRFSSFSLSSFASSSSAPISTLLNVGRLNTPSMDFASTIYLPQISSTSFRQPDATCTRCFASSCLLNKPVSLSLRSASYAKIEITKPTTSAVTPISVSMIVQDFNVVFSSISRKVLTSQNPASFT